MFPEIQTTPKAVTLVRVTVEINVYVEVFVSVNVLATGIGNIRPISDPKATRTMIVATKKFDLVIGFHPV